MKRIINTIKGKPDFSYFLEKSIDLIKKYQVDTSRRTYYDLVVKRIRDNDDSMSLWISYISDILLPISRGETLNQQKRILKMSIIAQIEICLISQEIFPNIRSENDRMKLAKRFYDENKDIETIIVEQAQAYMLSQAAVFTLEYLLTTEYYERNLTWAYAYECVYANWLDLAIQLILEEDVQQKVVCAELYKIAKLIKTEYCLTIEKGGSPNFDIGAINEYLNSEDMQIKPGIIHCDIKAV